MNHLINYESAGGTTAQEYTIQSYGKDGSSETAVKAQTTNFNNDIVFSGGVFVEFPEGAQN